MSSTLPLLTICVPTYNRSRQLQRVLGLLRDQVLAAGLERHIAILVGDNASQDETPSVIEGFEPRGVPFESFRQPQNLGFDGNIWELYRRTRTGYIWYFSDDDIPRPGCVEAVYRRIDEARPAVLLFAFEQPVGVIQRPTHSGSQDLSIQEPRRQAEAVTSYPKLTIFVMRRCEPTPELTERLKALDGTAYTFVTLALEALSAGGSVELLAAAHARCDDGYGLVRFSARTWGQYTHTFGHPFILRWAPALLKRSRRASYLSQVSFLWAWRRGALQVLPELEADYWQAIGDLPLRWNWLLTSPSRLVQTLVLKVAPRRGPLLLGQVLRLVRSTSDRLRRSRAP